MRKLCLSILAAGALAGFTSSASAFEAMLGGEFDLHARPHSRQHITTLAAGDIVNIDNCNRNWCAVTHGPHFGYIHLTRMLDGTVYGPRSGLPGYHDGGAFDLGADVVTAPFDAAEDVLDAGVSVLR